MASTLLELPLEVLLNITSHLDTPSYGNLRRVCSTMEKSTFEAFAKEFFSTKQFMITSFSLQTLLEISQHQIMSKYVSNTLSKHRGIFECISKAIKCSDWTPRVECTISR